MKTGTPFTVQDMNFITDFKKRRLRVKLTLRQVEEETKISNCYLSQLENGKITNPSFWKVISLHNLYSRYENNIKKA